MSDWISVKEKLPEYNKEVLVNTKTVIRIGKIVGTFAHGDSSSDETENLPVWQFTECCGLIATKINYWMPLPEPPKDQ